MFRLRPPARKPVLAVVAVLTAATAALATAAIPSADASTSALPALGASSVYVTGVSSGGFMATQLQVAYSGEISGAGIIAAGPYDCGAGNVIDFETCDLGISTSQLEAQAQAWASQGLIDPVSNLRGKPVYVYHGELDPVVNTLVANSGVSFYQYFGADVTYHNWDPAGHGWPSPLGPLACPVTTAPFIINCGDDPEQEMLDTWFGSVNAPNNGSPKGTLTTFSQASYVPGGNPAALGLNGTGFLYTPTACTAAGADCKLVVALHGCLSDESYLGDLFPEDSYLDEFADTNKLIVIYPQTVPTVVPADPEGCWDWWGYDGSNFAVKSAPQMVAIMHMVAALQS
jgi:poly(3-hydroxybutyrate) depolymerase